MRTRAALVTMAGAAHTKIKKPDWADGEAFCFLLFREIENKIRPAIQFELTTSIPLVPQATQKGEME